MGNRTSLQDSLLEDGPGQSPSPSASPCTSPRAGMLSSYSPRSLANSPRKLFHTMRRTRTSSNKLEEEFLKKTFEPKSSRSSSWGDLNQSRGQQLEENDVEKQQQQDQQQQLKSTRITIVTSSSTGDHPRADCDEERKSELKIRFRSVSEQSLKRCTVDKREEQEEEKVQRQEEEEEEERAEEPSSSSGSVQLKMNKREIKKSVSLRELPAAVVEKKNA